MDDKFMEALPQEIRNRIRMAGCLLRFDPPNIEGALTALRHADLVISMALGEPHLIGGEWPHGHESRTKRQKKRGNHCPDTTPSPPSED